MTTKPAYADFWPCACIKRDKAGNITHFKLHHPSRRRCGRCKAERPETMDGRPYPPEGRL